MPMREATRMRIMSTMTASTPAVSMNGRSTAANVKK